IGGTTLTVDNNYTVLSETGWWRSGGGVSFAEYQPAYQLPFQSTGKRTTPDFAYNADSASPHLAYDSYGYRGLIGRYRTSAGAPQWAALVALADQALAQNGVGSLDGFSQTLPLLYKLAGQSYATYYNDIVSGSNGYQAGPGYDYVTGIGSPVADQIVLGILN